MSTAIQSRGVALPSIFDPYVAGTTKARNSGLKDNSNELSNLYANIIYGSAAAATGIKSEGADLNTLYAKLNTTSYALSINGNDYGHLYFIVAPHHTGHSAIGFELTSGTAYAVYWTDALGGTGTLATGAIPAASYRVQYTWGAYTIPAGDSDGGGGITNGASTPQLVSTTPSTLYTTMDITDTQDTHGRRYAFTVDFFDSSGRNISRTVIYLTAEVDGSH